MAKSKTNNWDDVKMVIATISVTLTLAFWHIFAAASSQTETTTEIVNASPVTTPVEPMVAEEVAPPSPTQTSFSGVILLGGSAPQPRVVHTGGGGGGNNNNGAITSTKSS